MISIKLSPEWSAEIGPLAQKDWDDVVTRFQDASIYQTWAYGTVRWGERSVEHVVVRQAGEVAAAAQVTVKKVFPGFPGFVGLAYVPWGPLWRPFGKEADHRRFQQIISVLRQHYAIKSGLLLRVAPNIPAGEGNASTVFDDAGYKLNSEASPYRTLILGLSPSLDELRKGLKQKWRNCLNQSERNTLVFKSGTGDDLYREFLRMQAEMLQRKNFTPGVDYDEFGRVQEKLNGRMKMNILLCLTDSAPNASLVYSITGNSGIYLLGASNMEGRRLRSAYLLQWKVIEQLKQHGMRYYDLGGIDPDANPGVHDFKSGLGGKEISHIGRFEACRNPLSRVAVNLTEKFRLARREAPSASRAN